MREVVEDRAGHHVSWWDIAAVHNNWPEEDESDQPDHEPDQQQRRHYHADEATAGVSLSLCWCSWIGCARDGRGVWIGVHGKDLNQIYYNEANGTSIGIGDWYENVREMWTAIWLEYLIEHVLCILEIGEQNLWTLAKIRGHSYAMPRHWYSKWTKGRTVTIGRPTCQPSDILQLTN